MTKRKWQSIWQDNKGLREGKIEATEEENIQWYGKLNKWWFGGDRHFIR